MNKTFTLFRAFFALCLLFVASSAFAGGSSSGYYSKVECLISTSNTGAGLVYVNNVKEGPADDSDWTADATLRQSSTNVGETHTYYVCAKPNEGYKFVGISTASEGVIGEIEMITPDADGFCKVTIENVVGNSLFPTTSIYSAYFQEITTGITSVQNVELNAAPAYSLDGRLVGNRNKGIFIRNGRKYTK